MSYGLEPESYKAWISGQCVDSTRLVQCFLQERWLEFAGTVQGGRYAAIAAKQMWDEWLAHKDVGRCLETALVQKVGRRSAFRECIILCPPQAEGVVALPTRRSIPTVTPIAVT